MGTFGTLGRGGGGHGGGGHGGGHGGHGGGHHGSGHGRGRGGWGWGGGYPYWGWDYPYYYYDDYLSSNPIDVIDTTPRVVAKVLAAIQADTRLSDADKSRLTAQMLKTLGSK